MKAQTASIVLVSLASVALSVPLNAATSSPPESARHNVDVAAKSYIFVFHSNVAEDRIPQLSQNLAGRSGGTVRHIFTTAIKGFSATISPRGAHALASNNPSIAYFEPNGVAWAFKKPPWAGGDGEGGSTESQTIPWGVERVGAPLDGTNLHAWVIDTGIDLDHEDLNVGYGENFVLRGKRSPDDGHGHGTHVAGTIGAIDNTLGVVGVAAGATLHPVRVLDNSGSGTVDGVVAGVDWVAQNASPGDCANMSLGASGHFASLHDAVTNAANSGIFFSIAAGNDSNSASNYEPAHVESPNVFTVSAVDAADTFASFSNFGNPPVDFSAPGVSVLSSAKGGGTTTLSGTSMAAPHVCGLLLFGAPPNSEGTAINDPDGNPDPIAHY